MLTLGERIKRLRTDNRLTQECLGKVMGVCKSSVCQWESGVRRPDSIMLQRLADYFDVSVDYLLGRVKDDPGLNELYYALSNLDQHDRDIIAILVKEMHKKKSPV